MSDQTVAGHIDIQHLYCDQTETWCFAITDVCGVGSIPAWRSFISRFPIFDITISMLCLWEKPCQNVKCSTYDTLTDINTYDTLTDSNTYDTMTDINTYNTLTVTLKELNNYENLGDQTIIINLKSS